MFYPKCEFRKLHEQPQKQRLEMVILNLRQTLSIHDFDYQRHLEAQHLAITWIMKRPGNGYDIYRFINLLSCKALFRFLRVVVVIYIVFKNSNKLIAISCYFSQSLSLIYKQLSESADVQKAEKLILVQKTSDYQEVTSHYPTSTREYFQRAHYVRKEGSKVLKKKHHISILALWYFSSASTMLYISSHWKSKLLCKPRRKLIASKNNHGKKPY